MTENMGCRDKKSDSFSTFITSVDINVNYYITLTFVSLMMKTGDRDRGDINRQTNNY